MNEKKAKRFSLNEDWWAVIAASLLIALSALGVIGETGLQVTF